MIDVKALTHEEELIILEEGLKSRFWELFTLKYQHMIFTMMGAALGEKTETRDWQAGKASGMKDALNYPAKRARDLKHLIANPKSKVE